MCTGTRKCVPTGRGNLESSIRMWIRFSIEQDDQGRWVVEVHQVVRDLQSNLLLDTTVYHTYQFRDGLIVRMDISKPTAQSGENA